MFVTLNEGYLRPANRGTRNFYRVLIKKITYQPSDEKTNFFGLSFITVVLHCRSTKRLRLFSVNLPAMFNFVAPLDLPHCQIKEIRSTIVGATSNQKQKRSDSKK